MGATVMDILANAPYRQQEQQNRNAVTQAQLPGIAAQSQTQQTQAQMQQRQLLDQQVFSDAFKNAQGDWNGTMKAIMTDPRGMSPQGFFGLQGDHFNLMKNAATLDKEQQEALNMHLEQTGQQLEAWHDIQDPQAKAAAWSQLAPTLRPDLQADPSKPPDDSAYQMMQGKNNYLGTLLEHAKQQQTTQTSAAEAAKAAADTAKTQQETGTAARQTALQALTGVNNPATFDQWRQQYPDVARELPSMYAPQAVAAKVRSIVPAEKQPEFDLKAAQAKALQAYANMDSGALDKTVDGIVPANDPMNASTKVLLHSAAARGDLQGIQKVLQDAYDQRGKVQVAKENAQNKLQIDLGGFGGSADQPNTLAKMVGDYRMPLSQALQRTPPAARSNLMAQVNAYNPQFQEQYYNTFQKTENDAVTGKIGTSANALNTMMGHLSVLNTAADALKNGDVQALNKIANWAGAQVGQTPQTTYETIVHRLGPEVTKAYLASGGSVGERGTNEEDFSPKLSPDQIKQNIGVSALLADSKIKALQDQYQRGTYGRGQQKLISDEAEQARQTLTTQAPAALRAASGNQKAQGGYLVGHMYGKLEYLGGDPKDQNSWKQH
jgi:hypothetical protein